MITWNSPAKINLYLAVLGVRPDGFHEIDSLVGILDFGDDITIGLSSTNEDEYECSIENLAFDEDNLIRKALESYREHTGFIEPIQIRLEKRIPMGAGLGGGSSNASTVLKALDAMNPNPIGHAELALLSAEIGSDCPLFFGEGLSRIRGRGEVVDSFSCAAIANFLNFKVVVFHPGFGVNSGWAYNTLRNQFPDSYSSRATVAAELNSWKTEDQPWLTSHRNDLSTPINSKYLAIPVLMKEFEQSLGKHLYMSGSGSSCYCILGPDESPDLAIECVRSNWGQDCFARVCSVQ